MELGREGWGQEETEKGRMEGNEARRILILLYCVI